MKRLLVLRHAKSDWKDANLSDFERPLNERGLRTAPFMGSLIARERFAPAQIVSSPAERARHTAELVKTGGHLTAEIISDDRIYEASPQDLGQVVSELDDIHASAMLVGHNPGIEGFVRFLTGTLEPMPTASLAVIELDIDKWSAVTEGCGKLRHIFRPKDEMR